jgi:multidrug efflux pump subunit AcrA (membrane-fusion protein)
MAVKDGLKAGERVVVEGIQKVRPGQTVQATEAAGA